jgi:hypothetical protein
VIEVDQGTVHVYTYKTGVLSRVAHDLRLTLGRFSVRVDGETLQGRFPLEALRVDGVIRDGRLDTAVLSSGDRGKIEKAMHEEILRSARYAEATLTGTLRSGEATHVVEGTLTLRGREVPIRVEGSLDDGRVRGRVELAPSRWGIAPYKALLGAIQLQDRVTVAFDLEAPGT